MNQLYGDKFVRAMLTSTPTLDRTAKTITVLCETCQSPTEQRADAPSPRKFCDSCRRQRHIARVKAWSATNPEKARELRKRLSARRERRAVLEGPPFDRLEVFESCGWVCGFCNEPVDPEIQYPDPKSKSLDHIIPLVHGGAHSRENVRLAHLGCNTADGNRWRTWKPSLAKERAGQDRLGWLEQPTEQF